MVKTMLMSGSFGPTEEWNRCKPPPTSPESPPRPAALLLPQHAHPPQHGPGPLLPTGDLAPHRGVVSWGPFLQACRCAQLGLTTVGPGPPERLPQKREVGSVPTSLGSPSSCFSAAPRPSFSALGTPVAVKKGPDGKQGSRSGWKRLSGGRRPVASPGPCERFASNSG